MTAQETVAVASAELGREIQPLQFTPGPYEHNGNALHTKNGKCVAVCDGPNRHVNARFLSAAPELYEALAGMLSIEDSVTRGQERERRDEWIPKARAALAKASGR